MNFNKYINQITNKLPSKIYQLPLEGGKLEIEEEDIETYKSLFFISPNKGIGNGELALYWLFSPNSHTNHAGDNCDLILSGSNCEIKSYPQHFSKVVIGRWRNDHNSHYIINSLFSYYNINQQPYNFYSETNFNIENVKNSYKVLFDTNKMLSNHKHIPYIDQLYSHSLSILSLITGSNVEELSKNVISNLIITKLNKKPGDKGYIVNILPDSPLDIYIHKIDLSKLNNVSYEILKNNVDIAAAQIRINYTIFK